MGRRKPMKSAASSSGGYTSSRWEPPDELNFYWNADRDHGRPVLKTVAIVAPLTGRVLTLFHHYAGNSTPDEENPAALELLIAVKSEHPPPPDYTHDWKLIDPETSEDIETTLDNRAPFDTVHAILTVRDSEANEKKYEEWRAAGYNP